MSTYEGLSLEYDDEIAIVTLETMIFRFSLAYELGRAFTELDSDPKVGAVIITGRKNVFLSGGDLKEFSMLNAYEGTKRFLEVPSVYCLIARDFKKPLIAAINGYCLGGGLELALACDFRIAVSDVQDWAGTRVPFIGFPEASHGIVPGLGGTHLLPKLVGVALAKEVLYLAEPITADRALEIGLIDRVVPQGELLLQAYKMARSFLKNSRTAVRYVKRLVNQSSYTRNLDEGLGHEREAFARCCEETDKRDRIDPF